MNKPFCILFLLILLFANCNSNSVENKIKAIMAEVTSLQSKQDPIVIAMTTKPNVFSQENINNFPGNRLQLEPTAREQINSLNQLIEIDKEQINKLKEIENLPIDKNFLQYSKLNREIFEKHLENKFLAIQKFQLLFDGRIATSQELQNSISPITQRQSDIDSEISQLENQPKSVREAAGK